jgi:hypothetical protein
MVFFICVLGLLPFPVAVNWNSLGRPQWQMRTIIIPYALFSLALGITLFRGALSIPALLYHIVFTALFAAPFGFVAAVIYLQRGAYQRWHNIGDTADHIYHFKRAWLVGILVTAAFSAVLGGLLFATTAPRTFNGEHFTLRYSRNWFSESPRDVVFCQQSFGNCILYLTDNPDLEIVFVEGDSGFQTSSQIERYTWEQIHANNPTWEIIVQRIIVVDGHVGALREFDSPNADYPDQYLMQVYFVDGPLVLEVTVAAANRDAFEDNRDNINEVIEAIKFKALD